MNRKRKNPDFAYCLTKYFNEYLQGQEGVTDNTFLSYRDTFSIFLSFCSTHRNLAPEKMSIDDFNRELIESFLVYLSGERKNSDASRNQRLAAIHGFFKFVSFEKPEYLSSCQQILSVPFKKTKKGTINFLTYDGIKTILSQPDMNTKNGRRDIVLLSTLYDTAARVAEIADLTVSDLQLGNFPTVRLTGKGQKTRRVPINPQTALLLRQYLSERNLDDISKQCYPVFSNRMSEKLTRAGIAHILKKHADQARKKFPELIPEKISPHSLRHSKAVHLLQAGVNLIYIRDLLGHESIVTTEVYAKVDSDAKRVALNNAYQSAAPILSTSWKQDAKLINWLKNLGPSA